MIQNLRSYITRRHNSAAHLTELLSPYTMLGAAPLTLPSRVEVERVAA